MAPPTSGPCAYCDSPGMILKCDLCADAPTDDLKHTRTSFFCNEKCKADFWQSHEKERCKAGRARKALKLFADTFQRAFYIISKENFETCIGKVTNVPPKELIVHGVMPRGLRRVNPPPEHIWKTLNSKDRAGILSWKGSIDALCYTDAMIKAYVEGKRDHSDLLEYLTKMFRAARGDS